MNKHRNSPSSSSRPIHCIYYEGFLDIRAGGPSGYLANLKEGIETVTSENATQIVFCVKSAPSSPTSSNTRTFIQTIKTTLKKALLKISVLHTIHDLIAKRKEEYKHIKKKKKYINKIKNIQNSYANSNLLTDEVLNLTKSIHVHSVDDLVKVRNLLKQKKIQNIKLILTCHTPESVADEVCNCVQGYSSKELKELRTAWEKIERLAYKEADIIIAPSEEALEPAKNALGKDFIKLTAEKTISFVATGVQAITPKLSKEDSRRKYNVQTRKVIGFLGRHNAIKGYDILKKAAAEILEHDPDITFLIAGNIGSGKFAPLNHPRWIECGRVDPAEFLPALDIFVLPNRHTYYDLAFLEVMSIGTPIICSYTGGNISLINETKINFSYIGAESELKATILSAINSLDQKTLDNSNKEIYLKKFTHTEFAKRYLSVINNINK